VRLRRNFPLRKIAILCCEYDLPAPTSAWFCLVRRAAVAALHNNYQPQPTHSLWHAVNPGSPPTVSVGPCQSRMSQSRMIKDVIMRHVNSVPGPAGPVAGAGLPALALAGAGLLAWRPQRRRRIAFTSSACWPCRSPKTHARAEDGGAPANRQRLSFNPPPALHTPFDRRTLPAGCSWVSYNLIKGL
jgi:hypothetical protein